MKVFLVSLGVRRKDAIPADTSFAQSPGELRAAFIERRNNLERERGGLGVDTSEQGS